MQPSYGLSGAQWTNNRYHPEYNSLPNRTARRRGSHSSTSSAPDLYGDFRKYGVNSGVRRELLKRAVFDDRRWIQYVEMSKLQAGCEIREGLIRDGDIRSWLAREIVDQEGDDGLGNGFPIDPHLKPRRSSNAEAPPRSTEAELRLLFCDRASYDPIGFCMSQSSFLEVERAFNLPPTTLEAAFDYNGVYARYYNYSDDDDESVESIGLVLKFPQSQYAGFYMVSLTYTPATQTTNALIIGAMPIQERWIIDNIKHSVYLWQHPLLLPCILFNNHLQNTQQYCQVLDGKIVEVEGDTGFVQAGRLTWADPSAVPKWSKLDLEGLTRRLHSCLAELIFADGVSHFRIDCAEFLLKTIKELQQHFLAAAHKARRRDARELEQSVEYMQSASKHLWYQIGNLQKRAQSQIGVIYSMIAQDDNKLSYSVASDSAQIAVASKRDSSAMKTIALITVLFLPGTFVATLFSMSMFEWNPSPSPSSITSRPQVSPFLWIYWVITVPFTLFVLLAWRIWWKNQDRRYQEELKRVGAQHPSSNPPKI